MLRFVSLYLGLIWIVGCGPSEAPPEEDAATGSADPEVPNGHIAADFDPSAGLVVGVTQMVQHHPQSLVDIVRAVGGEYPVFGLTNLREEPDLVNELLDEHGVPRDHIDLMHVPMQTMWIRDFGPVVARANDGRGLFIDGYYKGTEDSPDDDSLPATLAIMLGGHLHPVELQLDGGMVLSNGRGLVLLATSLLQRHMARGMELGEVHKLIQASLPSKEFILIRPLPGEPTGHLDVFMALVEPDLCVMAQYSPQAAPQLHDHTEQLQQRIGNHPTTEGPLRIARIPTPPPGDGWFSYTNLVQIGDLVLVPTYQQVDDHWNEGALEFYRQLLPDRRIKAVDATTMIRKNGAIRCATFTLPMDAKKLTR